MNDSSEITKTIKKAMIDRGMNQKSLAKSMDKSSGTVSKWFSDIDCMRLGDLRMIARKLGLTIKIE